MVAHLLWEQRVAGSNPVTPTTCSACKSLDAIKPGRPTWFGTHGLGGAGKLPALGSIKQSTFRSPVPQRFSLAAAEE